MKFRPARTTLTAAAFAAATLTAGLATPTRVHAQTTPDLGINLSSINFWNNEYPFTNIAKKMGGWRLQKANSKRQWNYNQGELDEQGYPLSVPEGSFYDAAMVVSASGHHLPSERLVVLYDGTGDVRYSLAFQKDEAASTPGRDVINVSPQRGSGFLEIHATDADDHVRNVRVYFEEEAPAEGSTEAPLFRQAFLDRWSGFDFYRFMDWGQTNHNNTESWSDRAEPDDFSYGVHVDDSKAMRGIPYEMMIELSNAQQTDAWICIPHLANDDYVRKLAELVKQELDPELTVYFELSNEVWNWSFPQTKYAKEEGVRQGLHENENLARFAWYGNRANEMFKIIDEVMTDVPDERVVFVVGTHSENPWATKQILKISDVLETAEALAIAPYFSTDGFPDYKDGLALEKHVADVDTIFSLVQHSLDHKTEKVREQKAIADEHGLDLLAYEAGQHFVSKKTARIINKAKGGDKEAQKALEEQIRQVYADLNVDPRMKQAYIDYIQAMGEAGVTKLGIFASMSGPSQHGSWGITVNEASTAEDSPKYAAVLALLKGERTNGSQTAPAAPATAEPQ